MARGVVFALIPLLVVVALLWAQPSRESVSQLAREDRHASDAVMAPDESGVKMLSDEELFALFPGRSLALLGNPGQQELVFLDRSANPAR